MTAESMKNLTRQELCSLRNEAYRLIIEIDSKEIMAADVAAAKTKDEELARILKNKKVADAIKVLKSAKKPTKKHVKIIIDFDIEYSLSGIGRYKYKQTNIKSNIKNKALKLYVRQEIADACVDILGLVDLKNLNNAEKIAFGNLDYEQREYLFNN